MGHNEASEDVHDHASPDPAGAYIETQQPEEHKRDLP